MSVPQPQHPRDVVFIAPRNIDALRKLPLVTLIELKRRGVAVIPLVAGLLPLEPTGDPHIDRFLGCMTSDGAISRKASGDFPTAASFVCDPAKGQLRFGDVDLSTAMLEEAQVNRRRYTIDFDCPALQVTLQRLGDWTERHARVLAAMRRDLTPARIRAGFLVLQQSRLPDAVVRLWLDRYGHAKDLFCLHATNGYQNYFANFSQAVSTRMAVRNMTRDQTMRSASFVSPAEFDAFYAANRDRAPQMLAEALAFAAARNRKAEKSATPPETGTAIARINAWRAEGGRVACLFGRIVCDSAAPYDGGPAHANLRDWLNDSIDAVRDSRTLLLIKPHPHERRNEIGAFLTEDFADLIDGVLPPNVLLLGHDWLTIGDLDGRVDLGVLYNGTTAIEMALIGIPCLLAGRYGPIDYPVGHVAPSDRAQYRRFLRFEEPAVAAPDLRERAAAWLAMMSGSGHARDYRYHARPITNRAVYPPWWFRDDWENWQAKGDVHVDALADRMMPPRAA